MREMLLGRGGAEAGDQGVARENINLVEVSAMKTRERRIRVGA